MRTAAAQFGIIALVALSGHLTAWGQTTVTAGQGRQGSYLVDRPQRDTTRKTTDTVSVVASKLPLSRVAMQIEDQTGISINLKGGVGDSKVTVIAPKPVPIEDVFSQITSSNADLLIKQVAEGETPTYEIWQSVRYEETAGVVKVYQLREAWARNIERLVRPVISRTGSVTADDRSNKLIVYDIPEKQSEIQQLIAELDQPLTTRIFTMRQRNATEMARYVVEFCNLEKDQLVADDVSGQIAVRGTTVTIERAAHLIEAFDVPSVSGGKESAPRR